MINKYKIAQEVLEEWNGLDKESFVVFLREKLNPPDRLYAKFKIWWNSLIITARMEKIYESFTLAFEEDLKGTVGLDEVRNYAVGNGWSAVVSKIDEIKERLGK